MRLITPLVATSLVLIAACGEDPASDSSTEAAGNSGGLSGGASNMGTMTSLGGATSAGPATTQGLGGTSAAASTTTSGSMGGVAGAPQGGTAQTAQGGATTTLGEGGSMSTTSGTPTGAGGTGGVSGVCTRDLLESTRDAYFAALAAHDASTLPLADGVKFTENGESSTPGEEGLWQTAGEVKYSHSALDTETCNSVSQAVVPDGGTDLTISVRLKLEGGELTEIETIVPRSGDYILASNPDALSGSDDSIHWEEVVPEAERASYEDLTAWMDKYFRLFPQGVCNTVSNCLRIENGAGSFVCSEGAGCSSQDPSGQAELNPRLLLADPETGIGVGFTMFQGQYTDQHMFKMVDGEVYAVSAVLADAPGSGWD